MNPNTLEKISKIPYKQNSITDLYKLKYLTLEVLYVPRLGHLKIISNSVPIL